MHPAQTFLTRHGRRIAVVAVMGLAFVVWDLLASHPVTGLVSCVVTFGVIRVIGADALARLLGIPVA